MFDVVDLLAQQSIAQQEYGLGLALTIGYVLSGVFFICVPRFRKASIFVEDEPKGKKGKKKKKSGKRGAKKR